MRTITAANCKLTLVVRNAVGIIVGPFTVQGYASDDAFATEPVEAAIAQIGVDGIMSAGWVPALKPQIITLQADSASRPLFNAWVGAQEVQRDVVFASGALAYPGLQEAYALTKGVLTRYPPMPTAKRILQPLTYEITWEGVVPSPITV